MSCHFKELKKKLKKKEVKMNPALLDLGDATTKNCILKKQAKPFLPVSTILNDVLLQIFKYNGKLYGSIIPFVINDFKKGLQKYVIFCRAHSFKLYVYCIMPSSSREFFLRDIHEYLINVQNVSKYCCNVNLIIKTFKIGIMITFTNFNFPGGLYGLVESPLQIISTDLILMDRSSILCSTALPDLYKYETAPLLTLFNELTNKEFTFLADFIDQCIADKHLIILLQNAWQLQMMQRRYNSNRVWCELTKDEFTEHKKNEKYVCSICLEDKDCLNLCQQFLKLPCKHIFHKTCFTNIKRDGFKIKCPICRAQYNIYDL